MNRINYLLIVDCSNASCLYIFKNKTDIYLIRECYVNTKQRWTLEKPKASLSICSVLV